MRSSCPSTVKKRRVSYVSESRSDMEATPSFSRQMQFHGSFSFIATLSRLWYTKCCTKMSGKKKKKKRATAWLVDDDKVPRITNFNTEAKQPPPRPRHPLLGQCRNPENCPRYSKYMEACGTRERPTFGAFVPRAFTVAKYAAKVSLPVVGALIALRK